MAKLIFRYGAMGSSKTANALMVRYNYVEKGKKVVLLKPKCEDRDGEKIIKSRIGLEESCEFAEDFLEQYGGEHFDCIIVDEVQFLAPSAIDQLSDLVDTYGITVICYGLRTDFQSHLYTGVLQITDIDNKAIEVRQLFQKNRILLIVDNFETINDERIANFIESVCDNDRVIITTRENKIWNISSSAIYVEKLDDKEGISLIKHKYDKQSLDFKVVSSDSLTDLLKATDGSPLAIKWAVGQIATTRLPIERIITSLQTGQGDVFEKMFSSSWRSLDEVSQSLLYMLLFFSPTASREALFKSSGLDEYSFDISISKLSQLSLIEVNGENVTNQSYGLHPLTHSFVDKMKADSNIDDEQFYQPLLKYYIDFCREYGEKGTKSAYDKLENEQMF